MSIHDDRLLQIAVFLIIPTAILLGSLLMEASVCIAMVMVVWIIAGVLLYIVPGLTTIEDRS